MKLNELKMVMLTKDFIYYVDEETLDVLKCIVENVGADDSDATINVIIASKFNSSFHKKYYSSYYIRPCCAFEFLEGALEYQKKRIDNTISKYCAEIKSVDDLVNYPLNHKLSNYTNTNEMCIINAYTKRVKELLNIDISERSIRYKYNDWYLL